MNEQHLDLHARLEAHAILDRLVADGSTFPTREARRLIELIPVAPSSRVSFTGVFKRPGPGTKGHAAGIGDVNLDGETRETTFTLNVPTSHRIGGYVVLMAWTGRAPGRSMGARDCPAATEPCHDTADHS
jgi:hypothetical protein